MRVLGLTPVVGVIILICLTAFPAWAQTTDNSTVYVVKPGDSLIKIAVDLGNPASWKLIYKANRDKIKDPDVIYPGQQLTIPSSVARSDKFAGMPQKEKQEDSQNPSPSSDQAQQKALEEFRKAFSEVVSRQDEKKTIDKSPDSGLEFEGMVIDETRSKMGRDFFNVFYQYWDAPENAGNFMLTITEHPIPSLGTMVSVRIDDQEIYKSRLQPRYSIIEALAKQAVVVSYRALLQQYSNSTELTTY